MRYELRILALAIALGIVPGSAWAQTGDWNAVDHVLGRSGKAQPGDVQKYSFPRSDLRVTVGDVTVKPALALGSWVAFKRISAGANEAIVMGDLVLTESEVPAVVSKLQEGNIRQTALHNHLQRESPPVMYLHIEGRGDPAKLAQAIHTALGATNTPQAVPAAPNAQFPLDTAQLAKALGHGGTVNGGVYQVSIPRKEPVRMDGMEIPPSMGVATAINFQPTGSGKAAVTGDLVLTAAEVNPVIRALRDGGIAVTALHSHMLGEEPRLFFIHFWANADAGSLAHTLRAALDRTRGGATG